MLSGAQIRNLCRAQSSRLRSSTGKLLSVALADKMSACPGVETSVARQLDSARSLPYTRSLHSR